MFDLRNYGLILGLVILVVLASPVYAFGAGNIGSTSKVEGQNWRHGDIEDVLLTLAMARAMGHKKFNKIMVSRVYFGNWLRDYSQAIDVGTVKSVSAEAIRLLLCVLGFLTFGYGSGEFEVTADRLGCYRPEDHIDNPKNYADNQDARQYDHRLRGPIDERTELSIEHESGMKNYIANERAGIMTSAQHVRNLLTRCIELGRRFKNSERKEDLHESLRLLGTGLHCLEDFLAHSNYTELTLIEMGERDVFPHVGRNALIQLEGANGAVYPIVTGTFGGVDFLHSVVGEVSDKMTQNEIDQLEGTLQDSKNSDTSLLRDLLDKIPDSLLGGRNQKNRIDEIQDNASAAQVQNMSVSPRDPEEFTLYVKQIYSQIMPAIEFHDEIMKGITSAIEKIPVLPKIIEQLEEQLSRFVFSIMAPFVVPLIRQIKNELATGSGEIIQSSENEQHVVFNDDRSTDPTHSMLSKDHFSNILNEIAGRVAAKMNTWAVPQIMDAIDDENTDVDRLCTRIIYGILHHPAQRNMGRDGVPEARNMMFNEVREWWGELGHEKGSYRQKLSREGVMRGENHKEGVNDTGHGCCGKLKMRKLYGEPDTLENKIAGAAADAIFSGASGLISGVVEQSTGYNMTSGHGSQQGRQEEQSGLEGFLGKAGSILGGAFGGENDRRNSRRDENASYSRNEYSSGRQDGGYGQSQYNGYEHGQSSNYSQSQQSGYGQSQQSNYGQDQYNHYEQSQPSTYSHREEDSRHQTQHERRRADDEAYGGRSEHNNHSSGGHGRRRKDSNSSGSSDHSRREGKHRENSGYGREESGFGDGGSSYGGQEAAYGGSDSYGRQESSYRREDGGYGLQQNSYGGHEESNYVRQEAAYGEAGGYGRQQSNYSREESEYGHQESSYGDRGDNYGSSGDYYRRDENDYRREDNGEYARDSGRRQQGYGGGSGYGY